MEFVFLDISIIISNFDKKVEKHGCQKVETSALVRTGLSSRNL